MDFKRIGTVGKNFLFFFSINGAALIIVSVIFFNIYLSSRIETIVQNEGKALSFQKLLLEEKINHIREDVEYLSNVKYTKDFGTSGYDRRFDPSPLFKSFLSRKKTYTRIRIIDTAGKVKLEVEYRDGIVRLPTFNEPLDINNPTELQEFINNLSSRVSFREFNDKGFDADPVIAAGRKISSANGTSTAGLILSFPVRELFKSVYVTGRHIEGTLYFVDNAKNVKSYEYFDKDDIESLKEAIASPGWETVMSDDSGYLRTGSGIVSFVKFHFPGKAEEENYYLISFVSSTHLRIYNVAAGEKTWKVIIILLILAVFFSAGAAFAVTRRDILKNELLVLRAAFSQSANAIVITDPGGKIQFTNRAFQGITGYTIEELKNKNPRVIKSGYQNKDFYKNLWSTISTGKVWKGTFLNRRKDGSTFWEKATISPVRDTNGIIKYYMAVKEDITETKKIADELKVEKEQLEIARIEADKSREEAEKANKLKSIFLANISHEIRTPMNGILGFARILLEKETDLGKREQLGIILNSGSYLLELINDILDFSKIEAGEIEITPVRIRIHNIVEEVVALLKIKTDAKGIKIQFNVKGHVPSILIGDENIIRQIILNLAANAVKFTSKGEVRLSLSWKDRGLVIEVADTGIGIPPERHETIFEPFKQQDGSTNRTYGGTGLGLAICKRYTEIMGGEISVKSSPGRGSLFTVSLPLESGEDILPQAGDPEIPEAESLITLWNSRVEDETGMVHILRDVMKELPHRLGNLYYTVRAGDYASAKKISHSLKGITGNLKMFEVYEKLKEADQLLGESSVDENKVLRLCTVLYHMSEMFSRYGNGDTGTPDTLEELGPVNEGALSLWILAADDEEINRNIMKDILVFSGFKVQTAGNGVQVLQKLKSGIFDILLMDIQMPGMDGLQTIEKLRSDKNYKNLYTAAVTGYSCSGSEKEYLDKGFDVCLTKPVGRERLNEVIDLFRSSNGYRSVIEELEPFTKAFNSSRLRETADGIEERFPGGVLKRAAQRIRVIADNFDSEALLSLINELKDLFNGKG